MELFSLSACDCGAYFHNGAMKDYFQILIKSFLLFGQRLVISSDL